MINEIIKIVKSHLDRVQEEYDISSAEERVMDKNMRREFPEVHGAAMDAIAKAFRRRPR
ncbi:unnamed protein product [Protopolystoma xenopodis]|uniref:Uncharacterized protein n=1 Tax=Protopolystoma xenopodis TaxID=117903 RepID=A0A3S5A514_9PLAT|nr:unnamed protein product [Protopolystoma xenopodis]